MFILYQDKMKAKKKVPLKFNMYWRIFTEEFNLGFQVPKIDQCSICCRYDNLTEMERKTPRGRKQKEHIQRKNEARIQKDLDKKRARDNNNINLFVLTCRNA